VPFFSCCHHRVGPDVPHPCGITHATRIESPLDNLLFDRRRLAWIALVQQEGATSTASLAAPVPLLALPGLAMADNIRTVAMGTVQDLENHDVTRSRWGCSAAETLIENSTSTPVRHLRRMTFVPWQLGQCKTWRIIASLDYVGGYSGSHTPRENSRPTPLKHLPSIPSYSFHGAHMDITTHLSTEVFVIWCRKMLMI